METKKMTLWGCALRAALVLALAFGLVPSQALTSNAYAAGSGQSSDIASTIHSEDVPLEGVSGASDGNAADQAGDAASSSDTMASADSAAPDAAASASDSADTASQPSDIATDAASEGATSIPASADTAAPEQDDILSVQVDLTQGEGAATAIAFGGLAYVLNNDGDNTVTLTGWTGTAPKGALTVPAEITSGANAYKVSRIGLAGGGSRNLG